MFDIVEGREGWLFLRSDGSNTPLAHACDLSGWKTAVLPRIVASMRTRAARLRARGIPFVVLLTPESSSIYPDHLPPGFVPERPCAAELAAAALTDAGLNVVCPCTALLQARGRAEMFLRTDTHWTHEGAFIAYEALMQAIPGVPALTAAEVRFGEREGYGDLGVHLRPERRGRLTTASVPGRRVTVTRNANDQHIYSFRHTSCAQGAGRLLMLRDSAANALMPFLEATFAETMLVSPSPAMPDDAADLFRPGVVVLQLSEMGLYQPELPFADWPPRSFAQICQYPAGDTALDRLRAEALEALQAGDGARALAPASGAAVLGGEAGDLGVLAWALLNAGQYAACAAVAAEHGARFADAFLHYLHAQAAVHLGQTVAAREALARALLLRPGHALFLYSLAELEYKAGNYAAALAAVRGSLAGEKLFARSWVVAVSCLRRLGDDAAAARLQAEADEALGAGMVMAEAA